MAIQNNNNKYKDLTRVSLGISGVLLGATAIAGGVLISQPTLADTPSTTKTTDVSVSVSSVCNLTSDVTSAHTAEITPGLDFEDNIGTTDMTATCNDGNGYAIYAVGFTGDAIGQTNSTKLVGTGGTIDTRDYDASYKDTSYWSMQLTAGTGADAATIENSYNSYKAIPATYTKVASKASATSATPTTAFSTTYGAYAVTSQTAGDYSGKVKYILVHPGSNQPGTYTIAFSANGGTGTMASQTGLTNYEDQTINTMSGITAPSGYQFAGWCNNQQSGASATNPQTTCSGTTYNDNGTVPASTVNANGTLTLYAFWKVIPGPCDDIESEYCMQDVSKWASSLTTGNPVTAVDARDGSTYTVGKLADGNIWMLDNLALDLTDSDILDSLSSANTNIDSNNESAILTSLKSGNRSAGNQYATTGLVNWTSSYSFSQPMVNLTNKDVVPTDATSTAGGYKVGGYYNYCAASAGSYCYGDGTSFGTSSGNATSSICPAGWRMPTGDTSGEFQALYNNSSYNTYANYRAALHLPLSGYFVSGSPGDQGSNGNFWSSTRYSGSGIYRLYLGTSSVNPAGNYSRNYGLSLRCVAE